MKRLSLVYLITVIYISLKLAFWGMLNSNYSLDYFFQCVNLYIFNGLPLLLFGWSVRNKSFRWLSLITCLILIDVILYASMLKIALINEPIKVTDLAELANIPIIKNSIYNAETSRMALVFVDIIILSIICVIEQVKRNKNKLNNIIESKNAYCNYLLLAIIVLMYLMHCYLLVPKQKPPFRPGYEPWVSEIDKYNRSGTVRYLTINIIQSVLYGYDKHRYKPKRIDVNESVEIINNANKDLTSCNISIHKPNVIIILVEALSKLVFDSPVLKSNNIEVAPFIKSLNNELVYTDNLFSARLGGATSECEFVLLTSLMPPSYQNGYAYSKYMTHSYQSLPGTLKNYGYFTTVFHAGERDFWHRVNAYKSLGIDRYDSALDYIEGTQIGIGLSDKDFLSQTAEKLKKLPQPFFSMMITLSSHYPYDGLPDGYKSDISDKLTGFPPTVKNYLELIHYVDTSLRTFWDDISELRKNTIIVIVGDHNPAFYIKNGFNSLGYNVESNSDPDFTVGKQVPLVISAPFISQCLNQINGVIADQADVAPTIMQILGLPIPHNFIGESMFSSKVTGTQFTDGIIHANNMKYNREKDLCYIKNQVIAGDFCKEIKSKFMSEEIITRDVIYGDRLSY